MMVSSTSVPVRSPLVSTPLTISSSLTQLLMAAAIRLRLSSTMYRPATSIRRLTLSTIAPTT